MTGLESGNLSKYIGVLHELGYLERQSPATLHHPERSKQGRYTITDPYLRFYFRFLAPNLPMIALFARHGFTEAAQSEAASVSMQLVTLTQMENDMITWLKSPSH